MPASASASNRGRGSSRWASISSAQERIWGASLRAASSGDSSIEFSRPPRPLVLAVGDAGATAHVHRLAGHELRLVGGHEDHGPRDLLWTTQTPERDFAGGVGDHG